jgi:hypothetical protein
MNKLWFAPLVLFFSVACGADDCGAGDASHSEQRDCWQHLAASTAAEVTAAQATMKKRIEQYDDEAQVKSKILKHFLESAEQFRRYRASQCEFEASSAAGGNGAGDLRLQCQVRLNRTYVARLKEPLGML